MANFFIYVFLLLVIITLLPQRIVLVAHTYLKSWNFNFSTNLDGHNDLLVKVSQLFHVVEIFVLLEWLKPLLTLLRTTLIVI